MAAPRYEVRECWRCVAGRVYEAVSPTEGPRLGPCTACGGTGRVNVYLYPKTPTAAEEILMVRSLPSLVGGAGVVLNALQMVSNERKGR